jgi:hypothetical protein
MTVIITASISATGKASQIPVKPRLKILGRTKIKGVNIINCLSRDNIRAGAAFPIA